MGDPGGCTTERSIVAIAVEQDGAFDTVEVHDGHYFVNGGHVDSEIGTDDEQHGYEHIHGPVSEIEVRESQGASVETVVGIFLGSGEGNSPLSGCYWHVWTT